MERFGGERKQMPTGKIKWATGLFPQGWAGL